MRGLLLIVAMLLLAAPAMAVVTISAIDKGCGVVEVNYVCSAGEKVRAFALDVAVDNNFTIVKIRDFNRAESNSVAPGKLGYGIFPGKFRDYINPDSPNWVDPNYNPVAPVGDLDANTGLGTKAITVELGALYVAGSEPPLSGTLFRLDVNENKYGPADCNLRLTVNTTRRGIVDVNANILTGDANLVLFTGSGKVSFPDCFPCWAPYTLQYNAWKTVLKPDCWCGKSIPGWRYQCDGDADGKTSGVPFNYCVYNGDLVIMKKAYGKQITDPNFNACADFDHKSSGAPYNYRVYNPDLIILKRNWMKRCSELADECPRH